MGKVEIREKLREMRRDLTSKYIEDASQKIYDKVVDMDVVKNAKNVLIYSNFDNEVKTANLTGWLLYNGKKVYLPAVDKGQMHAADIKSAQLILSGFGTAQPDLADAQVITPDKIDLVILPGIAFDYAKNRIGFGKGYYDAYLKETKAYRLALAYDFQVIDNIETDAFDEKVDCIVTPDAVIV